MSIETYLRSHIVSLLLCVLSIIATYFLVRVLDAAGNAALLIALMQALFLIVAGLFNWFSGRRFWEGLVEIADAPANEVLSLASNVVEPEFAEGIIVKRALDNTTHAANAMVGSLNAGQNDYREFIESWVHEIKTPLAAANLMIENYSDPRLRPLCAELDRIGSYVEQALFYARSGSVENDYLIRDVSVDSMVKEAVKSRASELIAANISVELSGLGQPSPSVPCDPKWVVFVIGQLIDNAIRYRYIGQERSASISFSAHALDLKTANECVVLQIRDNGCGIPSADIGRVFEKGFTGENGRSRKKSTGLGLYLAHVLCEKMGLSVAIESIYGSWTCVSITFPRLKP
jgi:signal transduction histidine kinase